MPDGKLINIIYMYYYNCLLFIIYTGQTLSYIYVDIMYTFTRKVIRNILWIYFWPEEIFDSMCEKFPFMLLKFKYALYVK